MSSFKPCQILVYEKEETKRDAARLVIRNGNILILFTKTGNISIYNTIEYRGICCTKSEHASESNYDRIGSGNGNHRRHSRPATTVAATQFCNILAAALFYASFTNKLSTAEELDPTPVTAVAYQFVTIEETVEGHVDGPRSHHQ